MGEDWQSDSGGKVVYGTEGEKSRRNIGELILIRGKVKGRKKEVPLDLN